MTRPKLYKHLLSQQFNEWGGHYRYMMSLLNIKAVIKLKSPIHFMFSSFFEQRKNLTSVFLKYISIKWSGTNVP